MKPALSIMIRVSPSNSGVSTILDDFHSKVEVTAGFYVIASGGDPPPPTINGQFGSQQTSPPYLRLGSTMFVDPYGLPNLPATIGSFYFQLTNMGGVFDLTWANAYDGSCKTLLPDGALSEPIPYTETTDKLYIRVNTKTRSFRLFETGSGSHLLLLVGPLNISKVVPAGPSFILSELIGTPAAKFSASISGSTGLLSKDEAPVLSEELGFSVALTLFDEVSISGGTYTNTSSFRCLVLQ